MELYDGALAAANLGCERDSVVGGHRFYSRSRWSLGLHRRLKRVMDLMAAFIGSIATLFLVPIVALLAKLDDGGPVFYRSAYVAEDGKAHYYLKFRTMRVDADKVLESDETLRIRVSNPS